MEKRLVVSYYYSKAASQTFITVIKECDDERGSDLCRSWRSLEHSNGIPRVMVVEPKVRVL